MAALLKKELEELLHEGVTLTWPWSEEGSLPVDQEETPVLVLDCIPEKQLSQQQHQSASLVGHGQI